MTFLERPSYSSGGRTGDETIDKIKGSMGVEGSSTLAGVAPVRKIRLARTRIGILNTSGIEGGSFEVLVFEIGIPVRIRLILLWTLAGYFP